MIVGVTVIEVVVQVIVPSFVAPVILMTGIVLSKLTVTILLFDSVAQPLFVFVTTALYVPAALNEGVAEFSVPVTIPDEGLQLYDAVPIFAVKLTDGVGVEQVIETDDVDNVVEGIAKSGITSTVFCVMVEVQPEIVFVTTTVKIPLPLATGFDIVEDVSEPVEGAVQA